MSQVGKISYVSEISADHVIVFRGRRRKKVPFANEAELAEVLEALRDESIPFFEFDHGWPPSAVFMSLRERGVVAGSYASVSWTGPGELTIRTDR